MSEIERGELKFVKLSHKSLSKYKIGIIVSTSANIDPMKHLFFSILERLFKNMNFDSWERNAEGAQPGAGTLSDPSLVQNTLPTVPFAGQFGASAQGLQFCRRYGPR